jgi:hypothetical protein
VADTVRRIYRCIRVRQMMQTLIPWVALYTLLVVTLTASVVDTEVIRHRPHAVRTRHISWEESCVHEVLNATNWGYKLDAW